MRKCRDPNEKSAYAILKYGFSPETVLVERHIYIGKKWYIESSFWHSKEQS